MPLQCLLTVWGGGSFADATHGSAKVVLFRTVELNPPRKRDILSIGASQGLVEATYSFKGTHAETTLIWKM